MPTNPHVTVEQFLSHWKTSRETADAANALLTAHLRESGIVHALTISTVFEKALTLAGAPGSPVRAAFLAYLAAQDADYTAAVAAYDAANAYAAAAMKDDA